MVSERRIENTSRQRWYRRWCIGGGRLVGSRERSVDTPQQKGAKHNERARLRAARRARAFEHRACDEAARPRPHGPCADERDGATGQMHDGGASKVEDAAEERVGVAQREPAMLVPDPVGTRRVDEGDRRERAEDVRMYLCALRERAGHYGGTRRRVHERLQPRAIEQPELIVLECNVVCKEVHTRERAKKRAVALVAQGVAKRPPREGARDGVCYVLREDVGERCWTTQAASLQHPKASLHRKDQRRRSQYPVGLKRIHRRGHQRR